MIDLGVMSTPKDTEFFNREYQALHVTKEDLFWVNYMGTASENEKKAFEEAELKIKEYISDSSKIAEVRKALSEFPKNHPHYEKEKRGLEGWLRFFECNAVENAEAKKIQAELVALEAELFQKRASLELKFIDESGKAQVASTNVLSMNLSTSQSENVRKSSHQALLDLEEWVVKNGYLEIVAKRNHFARCLGYKNYFEYRVRKNEDMSVDELFEILNEFESLTRNKCFGEIEKLKKEKGEGAAAGHNLRFYTTGDTQRELDPYFPFEKSIENWVLSFARLGIDYRQAKLTLDLFDRVGKYENGFMHAPVSSYFSGEQWIPARINFTSNATPSQVGSGRDGIFTLFHEGGHAAHFSNITMNGICFSQEYPPTSMAYAETQSMFLDSLIEDADWLALYAKDLNLKAIPETLIQKSQQAIQPWRAYAERSILNVGVFERWLYELSDEQRTPEAVLKLARKCERQILGVECSPRPLLAIPHLLSDSSSCSYYGYLLAHMAVYQTRSYFLEKYGYICDNPQIGKDLSQKYWAPGNSLSHKETVMNLCQKKLSGKELAAFCNLDNAELWKLSQEKIKAATQRSQVAVPVHSRALGALIDVVDGKTKIASNEAGDAAMFRQFESYIEKHYRA